MSAYCICGIILTGDVCHVLICNVIAIADFTPVITFTSGCPVVVSKLSMHDFTLYNLGR